MIVKFKEIADYVAGQSPESKYYSNTEGIPFLQGSRTFGLLYPTIDTYTKKITKIAKKGDILMSVRAPVGDLNIAKEDLCIGRGLSAISSKTGNNIFLFYSLKYNIQNLIRQSSGTTFDSITRDVIENMNMIIPDDKSIHLKISKLLFDIDLKIDINNKINAELESMAKTLYDYWFLQFEFPNENGKPYKSSGGKMVWNEELKREIPKGWEVKKVGDILEEANKSKIQVNDANEKGKYPFFTSGESVLAFDEYLVDGFNIFLNTGGNPDIKAYMGKCAYSTDTWCVSAKEFSYVLYYHLLKLMPQFEQLFFAGSGLKHLQKDSLKNQYILLPDDKPLKRFNNTCVLNWKKTTNCLIVNQELTSLRDFLLPLLMNGQVTFKDK